MPFNISAFKTNGLVYGGSRPSNFYVTFSVPQGIGIDNTSVQKSTFMCETAALPSSRIQEIKVPYFGRDIKVAGNREFPEWKVKFLNDEDFSTRSMFETWSNAINRLVSNVRDRILDQEQYKVDMTVTQYGKNGEDLRSYTLVGAWPMDIEPMELNWGSKNEVGRFGVTFCMDYWIPLQESSSKQAGGINSYLGASETDGPLGAGL